MILGSSNLVGDLKEPYCKHCRYEGLPGWLQFYKLGGLGLLGQGELCWGTYISKKSSFVGPENPCKAHLLEELQPRTSL